MRNHLSCYRGHHSVVSKFHLGTEILIPQLLGVLANGRFQWNPSPEVSLTEERHFAQGHIPYSRGAYTYRLVGFKNNKVPLPCAKVNPI